MNKTHKYKEFQENRDETEKAKNLKQILHYILIPNVWMLSHFNQAGKFMIWIVACQVPLSVGFSRQEYWIGQPYSPPGDLPDPEMGPTSLKSPKFAGGFFTTIALQDYSK